MKQVPARAKRFWSRLKRLKVDHPRALKVAVAAVLLLAFYAVAKSTETVTKVVHTVREGDFKVAHIFGGTEAAVNEAKEKNLSKTANDILNGQKKTSEDVQKISARVDAIESKVKQNDAGMQQKQPSGENGAAGATAGASTGSSPNHAAPQLNQPSDSFSTEVIRPNGASAYGGSPYGASTRVGLMAGAQRVAARGPDVITFPVASEEPKEELGVVLPVGSYVKAKIIAGTDATTGDPDPVLLQLDYSHVLPNQRKIDLSGCFMTAKAQANLSTERVKMKTMKLSCVSKRGMVFEKEVNGYVADDADNKFAVSGPVNSKQDRVAAMAFLASVVEGVGKAVQQEQTTQQTTPLGGGQSVMTGDERKYLAGGAAANAAGMVAQWYLKQAEGLLPSITVGSGKDVWVIVLDNVNLPKEYFTKGSEHDSRYAYVTRILD